MLVFIVLLSAFLVATCFQLGLEPDYARHTDQTTDNILQFMLLLQHPILVTCGPVAVKTVYTLHLHHLSRA